MRVKSRRLWYAMCRASGLRTGALEPMLQGAALEGSSAIAGYTSRSEVAQTEGRAESYDAKRTLMKLGEPRGTPRWREVVTRLGCDGES